ncbi:hypothetical protein AB0J86_37010 [Micromonospora sp. NPDC049559]|uniref:hypothetical protein n=1 Tax=Micromonospora sp. NPDC049559 TaxID=3155923 RepID=UPI00341B8DCD
MTEQFPDRPLEEYPDVADAIDDDITAPPLRTGGGPDADTPAFREPGDPQADFPPTDDLIGDAASGPTGPAATGPARTGAEQPWDPEDLAVAKGADPTPENVARARRELEEDGPAAVERQVP